MRRARSARSKFTKTIDVRRARSARSKMEDPSSSFPKRCCGHTKVYVSRFGMGLLIVIGYFAISSAIQKTLQFALPAHELAEVIALWVLAFVAIALVAILTTPLDATLHSTLTSLSSSSSSTKNLTVITVDPRDLTSCASSQLGAQQRRFHSYV